MEFCTSSSGESMSVATQHPRPSHKDMVCVIAPRRMSSFDTIQASNTSSRYQHNRPRSSSTSSSTSSRTTLNDNPNGNNNMLLTGLMDMLSKFDCSMTTPDDHFLLQQDKVSPSSSSTSLDPYCGAMSSSSSSPSQESTKEDKENAKPASPILTSYSNRTRNSSSCKQPTPRSSSGRHMGKNSEALSRRRAPLQPTRHNYVSPSSRHFHPPQVPVISSFSSNKRLSSSSSSSSKTPSSTLEQQKKQEDEVVVRMIQTRLSRSSSDVTSQSIEVSHMMKDLLLTTDHSHDHPTVIRTTTNVLGRSNSTSTSQRRIKSPTVKKNHTQPQPQPQPPQFQPQEPLPIRPRLSLRWKKITEDSSSNRRKSSSLSDSNNN